MLKADFSQQDKDERKAPLEPGDHCLQLRQGWSRSSLVFLGILPRAMPLRASCCSGLLEQRGSPVLKGLVVEVMVVVLGRSREERSTLTAVGAPFVSGRRSHLDKNFRRRAQD